MLDRDLEEVSQLVFVPAALLRCGAVAWRIHQPGDVAVHEPGPLGVTERGTQDLVHVQYGLGRKRSAVVPAAATEMRIEVFEMGDGEAAQWHSSDVR